MSLEGILEIGIRNSAKEGIYRLFIHLNDVDRFEKRIFPKLQSIEKEYVYFEKQYYLVSIKDFAKLLVMDMVEVILG